MSEQKAQQREFYDTYSADFDEVELWLINGRQNEYRHRFMSRRAAAMRRLAGLKTGSRVLEIGCGTGNYTRFFARYSVELFAADLSAGMLKKATEKVSSGLHLIQSDAEHLPFASTSFDAVFSINMLEHLDNVPRALKEMKRVLRPGGKLVISTPNENPVQQALRRVYHKTLGHKSRSFKEGRYGEALTHQPMSLARIETYLKSCGVRPSKKLYMGFIEREISRLKWLLPVMEPLEKLLEKIPVIQTLSGVLVISGTVAKEEG